MAKGFGLSLDDKDDDDEFSQRNLGSMFRSWSFLFIGLSISLFSTKFFVSGVGPAGVGSSGVGPVAFSSSS
jgi:hypothetical protein